MFVSPDVSLPHVRDGTIKAYAATARSRLPAAPEIPTADKAVMPSFYFSLWYGLWTRVNGAVVSAIADPSVRQNTLNSSFTAQKSG